MIVVATLTFGSGLQTLVSHPALYGWNWDYMLNASNNVPPQALALLAHDPDVAAWTGVYDTNAEIDGQNVPVLLGDTHAALTPPILAGHAVEQKDQIVLGAATLAQLHKHIGDTVVVTYGKPQDAPSMFRRPRSSSSEPPPCPPSATPASSPITPRWAPARCCRPTSSPPRSNKPNSTPNPTLNGPNLVFVRLRDGVSPSALADMQRIADAADSAFAAVPDGGGWATRHRARRPTPAEIVNYRTMGTTPALLASGLAAGAVIALGLTLAASVRRRRHDLALLKTLGFTKRQLAAAVAWQASVAAVIGIIVGVPLGIILGRQLWILFARNIDAVPQPTVPVISVLFVMLGALLLANLVAAIPARSAART